MRFRRTVRVVVPALLLTALLSAAPAPAHVAPAATCDPQSDTYLFCESARLRDTVCVCGGRVVAGCRRPVKRLLGAVNEAVAAALRAREAGDGAGVAAGIVAAESALDKTSARLAHILGRRRRTQACGAGAGAAVDAFTLVMDERLGAFGSTTTTTTTTTTTLPDGGTVTTTTVDGGGGSTTTTTTTPPAVSCFGSLTVYPAYPSQVFFQAWCDHAVTQFAIVAPGGRTVTDGVAPVGFTCSIPMSDRYVCTGPLPADLWINGRMTLSPAPSLGMGSDLYAWYEGVAVGPFAMTGP